MAIEHFLVRNNISFSRITHHPVYTCDEANRLLPNLAGARTKNLFIVNRQQQHYFLLVMEDHKRLDWKAMGALLGGRLSMASADELRLNLRLEPGAVSILGLHNDTEKRITLVMDEDVWSQTAVQCHPLVNTATLVISKSGIKNFLRVTGHKAKVISVPVRACQPDLT